MLLGQMTVQVHVSTDCRYLSKTILSINKHLSDIDYGAEMRS